MRMVTTGRHSMRLPARYWPSCECFETAISILQNDRSIANLPECSELTMITIMAHILEVYAVG